MFSIIQLLFLLKQSLYTYIYSRLELEFGPQRIRDLSSLHVSVVRGIMQIFSLKIDPGQGNYDMITYIP